MSTQDKPRKRNLPITSIVADKAQPTDPPNAQGPKKHPHANPITVLTGSPFKKELKLYSIQSATA